MTGITPQHLLGPIRVLDMADGEAGFCSRLLADLGADVVRGLWPENSEQCSGDSFSAPAFYHTGKQFIDLNSFSSDGRQTFLTLAAKADVLIESGPPGKLESSGLGYDALCAANPGLVVVSVTGFGQTGPLAGVDVNELVIAAAAGQMHATGDPESTPLKLFGCQAAMLGSIYGAVAVLLALHRREKTGKGCHIDISLQEALLSALEHVLPPLLHGSPLPKRRGAQNPNTGYCLLAAKDGLVQLNLHRHWPVLAAWMAADGMAGELTEVKWEDERERIDHFSSLVEKVEAWTQTYRRKDLVEKGQLMQFPWAVVQTPEDILNCPQLAHRKFFHPMTAPRKVEKDLPCAGLPFFVNGLRPVPEKKAYRQGKDLWTTAVTGVPKKKEHKKCSTMKDSQQGILHGIRILDFTRVLSGPLSTRILADFGAEVIKVQSRRTATGTETGEHPYFKTYNRNKKSITLDMGFPESRRIVLDLAAVSDVVIENFSSRVLANWRLQYEDFQRHCPSVSLVSLSGMGQTGPWKNYAAYGQTVQAFGGLTGLTAYGEGRALGAGYAHADTVSALYGALAVLAAIAHRKRTGFGVFIDLSQYEAACTLIGEELMDVAQTGRPIRQQGNLLREKRYAPAGCYPCAGEDRWCVLAVDDDDKWQALCVLIGYPEWAIDVRFASAAGRRAHGQMIDKGIAAWSGNLAPEDAVATLKKIGIASCPVNRPEDLLCDLQLRYRRFFRPLDPENPEGELADACPIRMPGYREKWRSAPAMGADNRGVFMGLLGMEASRYRALREKGVIG